ncbi:MAG: radical SAM protein [Phycisphaerales bacterium]|nr:radical SAM protein [Phycisphaerales bacterium]
MSQRLLINEIFHSIQGESTRAGLPCIFIRLRGCHLRCSYCDTSYAFTEGEGMTIDEIMDQVKEIPTPLVELTGGEPLLQKDAPSLMRRLIEDGRTVLIETSGACDISLCPDGVIRIVDFKTPGSHEAHRNDWGNVDHLCAKDEVKFVICDRADFDWAREVVDRHALHDRVASILWSPVHAQPGDEHISGSAGLAPADLAAWMLEANVPGRLQMQLHKHIWDPATRGV